MLLPIIEKGRNGSAIFVRGLFARWVNNHLSLSRPLRAHFLTHGYDYPWRNAASGESSRMSHACFDPLNQRAPGHCALHSHEQWCPLLFASNRGQPFWAADLLEIAGEDTLCL